MEGTVSSENGTKKFRLAFIDITDLKRAYDAVRESESKMKSVFRAAPIGIGVVVNRVLQEVNDFFCEMTGYSREELIGRDARVVYPSDEEYEYVGTHKYKQIEKNQTGTLDTRLKRKDGRIIDVLLSSTAIEPGHPSAGVTFTALDITDRKRTEARLQQVNDTLEQQVAERTELAEDRAKRLQSLIGELTLAEQRERQRIAEILHDHLQQLLVGAKIHGEMLSAQTGAGQKELTESVLNLINQSIRISRSLTADLSPPVLKQGLSSVLEWICRRMQETQGLTVDLKTDPRLDPQGEDVTVFLYQSARELLLNVVKHAGVKSAHIEMSRDGQDRLRLTVSDQGSGFDPAAVRKTNETGFGLMSIRERLELMGGKLLIESKPGNGASFSLCVPLKTKEEPDERKIRKVIDKVATAKGVGEKTRVLVVDDHTVVRQGLSTMLNLHPDIEVVDEAADGEEAIRKARDLQPDVILMDISMPKMNGFEATRIISSEYPHTRIIGLSMHDTEDMADRMIEAGAAAYCKKDGDTAVLLSAILGEGEIVG